MGEKPPPSLIVGSWEVDVLVGSWEEDVIVGALLAIARPQLTELTFVIRQLQELTFVIRLCYIKKVDQC